MKTKRSTNQNFASPFNIQSIIGFNLKVAIKNLTSNKEHPTIVYASGHVVTIQNCGNNGMEYLLGHERDIAFVGVAKECKMLVTSDDNLVSIWERMEKKNSKFDTVLLKTFNDPFVNEPILSTGLSVDGEYLVLASRKYIKLWILRHNNDKPDAIHELIDDFRVKGQIVFCQNINQSNNFVVTTDTNHLFCKWNTQRTTLETHQPKPYPGVTQIVDSSYCSNYCKGVSITRRSVIMWSDTPPSREIKKHLFKNRMEFQYEMRLGFYQLRTVSCCNGFIIISDSNGEVKFHDENMRLYATYQLCGEIVNSICFKQENGNYETPPLEQYKDLSHIGTFFVSCENGRMYKCNLNTKPSLICDSAPVFMTCFDLHPKKEFLCGGRQDGQIFMYDYSTNTYDKCMSLPLELAKQLKLKPEHYASTCLSFSPCGRYIAAGTGNGFLAVLSTITFTLCQKAVKLAESNVAIEKAIFSNNNEFIAYLDESCKVGLLHYVSSWKLIRKCRVHDSPIVYMSFRETEGEIGLVTISEDYKVADYAIRRSASNNLELMMTNCHRVDYLSILKSCITLDRSIMAFPNSSANDVAYLTTDEMFKFQIRDTESLDVVNIFAAPISDEPITMMCHVNRKTEHAIAFSAKNIIGLQHLPIDGNPNKHLAMVGHPRQIRYMKVSPCNKYLFTIGDDDSSVYIWNIKMSALLQQYRSGGKSLRPFCNLLPGGVTGKLFNDMQDIFFYIQIRAQEKIESIELADAIPVSKVVDFMRCIGFFPSNAEAECIMNEMTYYESDATNHSITFENLMKIFVNYRPPFGYLKAEIFEILQYLGYSHTMQCADTEITRERLVEICTELGEDMDEDDAVMYLNRLDGKDEIDEQSADDGNKFHNIRCLYTVTEFMKYILGVE